MVGSFQKVEGSHKERAGATKIDVEMRKGDQSLPVIATPVKSEIVSMRMFRLELPEGPS